MNGSPDRDQSIERLLRQTLATPPAGLTDVCLDAETIAAWSDGALSGRALELAQSHVAACARCQALVAAVARTAAVVAKTEPAPRRWLTWLVPLTAAATAVALWVAIPRTPAPTPTAPAESQARVAEERPAPAAPVPETAPPPATPRQTQQEADSTRELRRREDAASSNASRDARVDQLADKADGARVDAFAAAPPPAAVAPAPAREGAPLAAAAARAEMSSAPGIIVLSPNPDIRWRQMGTTVERSTDGGTTWAPAATGIGRLADGAAPTTMVCWMVGSGGLVLLTADGRAFSRIAFPEPADLSAVQAADARAATVTTADGRTFVTADGGGSWARR